MITKTSFYEHNFEDLQDLLKASAISSASATLLYRHHYKEKQLGPCDHHNFSKAAKEFVTNHFDFSLPEIELVHESNDQTVKLLIKLQDGLRVESVLLPFQSN